jgi:hypothetical protein
MEKARKAKSPPKNISIHSSIRNLPKNHPLNFKKVQEWIKHNKHEHIRLRKLLRRKSGGGYNREINNMANILDVYILNMQSYLRTGVWLDLRYGQDRQFKIKYKIS